MGKPNKKLIAARLRNEEVYGKCKPLLPRKSIHGAMDQLDRVVGDTCHIKNLRSRLRMASLSTKSGMVPLEEEHPMMSRVDRWIEAPLIMQHQVLELASRLAEVSGMSGAALLRVATLIEEDLDRRNEGSQPQTIDYVVPWQSMEMEEAIDPAEAALEEEGDLKHLEDKLSDILKKVTERRHVLRDLLFEES